MPHYHLLVETPEGNLRRGMARLNAVYAQWFNRQHSRHGHLFQGRYQAILVERDPHLLELCRYVVLNPVRAGLVKQVAAWPWSQVTGQVYLGGEAFVDAMLRRVPPENREQIAQAALQPRRPTIEHVCLAVAKAAGVAKSVVLDRQHRQDVFQVTVYLLRRVCNESLKATAARAGVSAARVSQIQHQIEEAGGLTNTFPLDKWARR